MGPAPCGGDGGTAPCITAPCRPCGLLFIRFCTAFATIVTALLAVSVSPISLIEIVSKVSAAWIRCTGSACGAAAPRRSAHPLPEPHREAEARPPDPSAHRRPGVRRRHPLP